MPSWTIVFKIRYVSVCVRVIKHTCVARLIGTLSRPLGFAIYMGCVEPCSDHIHRLLTMHTPTNRFSGTQMHAISSPCIQDTNIQSTMLYRSCTKIKGARCMGVYVYTQQSVINIGMPMHFPWIASNTSICLSAISPGIWV